MNTPKRRIRQNVWGNWYGYLGNRRVEAFSDDPFGTAEEYAKRWLETGRNECWRPIFTMTFRRTA